MVAVALWRPGILRTTLFRSVSCELDPATPPTATSISVIIPADATFAKGKCVIAMQKTNPVSGEPYTEKVYSSETNFKN